MSHMTGIAKTDSKQSAKLEKRITANTKAGWCENGQIMLHIRNAGLYKAKCMLATIQNFETAIDQ